MATKLNAAAAKRVKALNITAKTEEEAREKLLEILVENGIEGMEDEELDTLLDIAESFVDEDSSDDDNESSEEDENDELAQEVEEEEEAPKKSAKKPAKKVEEPEEEEDEEEEDEEEQEDEDEEEGDEFADMDRTALKAYIKDNELEITVKKSMSDDDIREAIRAEVGETKPAPAKTKSTKSAEKPAAAKKEEKKPAAKTEKKADKKEAKPAAGKRGAKLDPKNNEDDREVFDALKELFPEDEYVYAWVASAGVTIKHKGKNSQRSMVLIENCSKQADGSIKCNLYLLTFTKQTEVLDEAGVDYEKCWSGAPLIKGITLDEAVEIITGLMEQITATVKKIDKKLGDNRKKMEENLDKKSPKAKKATAKVEEPEEEEDEEEEEAPKAKKTAKAPAKKAAKVEDDEEEDDEEEEAPKPKKAAAPAKKTTKKK
jgi:hypothetical protein